MSWPGTIYVDVDDVLARTTQRLVEFLHERHGRRVEFASLRWLECREIAHDQLACVDKYGRHGSAPGSLPLDELRTRRFDLAVEDSLETAGFLAAHTGARVALMDRPWNQDIDALPRHLRAAIVRVRDWDEIAALWRRG